MYNLMSKEELLDMFPILKTKETVILNMVSGDGISLSPPFHAMKILYPHMADGVKKNSLNGGLEAGSLLLHKAFGEDFSILTMPVQENWKTGFDADYVHKGFLKISSIFKERNIESIAIQEGVVPNDVIDKFIEILDLPIIVYYKET